MVETPESDAVVCVSELGFRLTRRRTGLSVTLPTLSSSVETEASAMGSSTRDNCAEGTNLDLLGRSLETSVPVLAGLIMCLSWLPILFGRRPEGASERQIEFLSDNRDIVARLLRVGDSICGLVFRVGDSGCARICVTRLLRLSGCIVG